MLICRNLRASTKYPQTLETNWPKSSKHQTAKVEYQYMGKKESLMDAGKSALRYKTRKQMGHLRQEDDMTQTVGAPD